MIASALVATLLVGAQPAQTSLVFLPHSTMATKSLKLNLGVREDMFRRCQNEVWLRISEAKFAPVSSDKPKRIADLLSGLVLDTEAKLKKAGDFKLNETGKAWLKAEACVAWAAKNCQ